jgi:hypothetical protein
MFEITNNTKEFYQILKNSLIGTKKVFDDLAAIAMGLQTSSQKAAELEQRTKEIYSFFQTSLDKMKREGADLVTIALADIPKEERFGGPHTYYDFDTLTSQEQQIIREKKGYQRFSLSIEPLTYRTLDAKTGIESIDTIAGLQVVNRCPAYLFLPELKPESTLNYFTAKDFFGEERMLYASEIIADAGYSKKEFESEFERGLSEYHAKTKELMTKAGIYEKLERMENRPETNDQHIDGVLAEMRSRLN